MEEQMKKIVSQNKNVVKEQTLVVDKLPTREVRTVEENGITYNLVTVEEFLTQLANK